MFWLRNKKNSFQIHTLIWRPVINFLSTRCTIISIYGPRRDKTCLWGVANNKGADQPAHPRRLISAFVIRFLESIISKLATSEISIFLASFCSWGEWFESHFVGHPEDRFCCDKAHILELIRLNMV